MFVVTQMQFKINKKKKTFDKNKAAEQKKNEKEKR